MLPVAGNRLGDPLPFRLTDHQPLAILQHPATRIDHDDLHSPEAALEAPLDPLGPAVGRDSEIAQHGRRVT